MKTLNQVRRRLVNYAVLLTILAVMSMVVGLSSRNALYGVATQNVDKRPLETTTRELFRQAAIAAFHSPGSKTAIPRDIPILRPSRAR